MKKHIRCVLFAVCAALCLMLCACGFGTEITVSQTQAEAQNSLSDSSGSAAVTSQPAKTTTTKKTKKTKSRKNGKLSSADDINLTETGEGSYTFTYSGKTYNAYYTPDNWKIVDSYQIKNKADMIIICSALSAVHQIHNKDYTDYRDAEDLAYEWEQHNTAYTLLPDSSPWKKNAKDVDLDPKDQGKSFVEMARDRLRK